MLDTFQLVQTNVEEKDNDITIQLKKPQIQFLLLADLIYKMNKLPRDDDGNIVYDASRLLVEDENKSQLVDRNIVETVIRPLITNDIIAIGSIGDPAKHFERWEELKNHP